MGKVDLCVCDTFINKLKYVSKRGGGEDTYHAATPARKRGGFYSGEKLFPLATDVTVSSTLLGPFEYVCICETQREKKTNVAATRNDMYIHVSTHSLS
jgi:hypothetical protein